MSESKRVTKAKELLKAGDLYPKGCSEFVCKVLGIPWRSANALLGDNPVELGSNNVYFGMSSGAVVGWSAPDGNGHVAIYVGEPGVMFIDVEGLGKKPRAVVGGYGPRDVKGSSEF